MKKFHHLRRDNGYKNFKRSRISKVKFRQILRLFRLDLNAKQIAELTGLNRNNVNKYLRLIREKITSYCKLEPPFSDEIEEDESFFGAMHVKGKRGQGAYGKTIVIKALQSSARE